jgi:hypothetical protein
MHWRIPIVGVLALFVAVSCNQQPVAPQQDQAGTTLSKVIFDSYVEPLGIPGLVDYVACANDGAGEFVRYTDEGFANVHWFSRTTPSGNEIVTCHIDYLTETPLGFVGLSSGDEYTLEKGEDNCRIITKPKGPQFFLSFQANEWYVNQNGETARLRNAYRLMIDAGGDVQVERSVFEYKCPGKPLKP